ncbi:hypothetical protein D5085_00120 [Ectothiorhodospiraceae bacterium BW-2]|nr:hypothetical protein D5085_00120 [Ectothiorhodospiraceae bacterium BW-2]
MEIIWILTAMTALFFATLLISRLPFVGHLLLFLLLPIGLGIYWFLSPDALFNLFGYIKFILLCCIALIIAGLRFKGWHTQPWARNLLYIFLFLNIGEAISFEVLDLITGGPEREYGGNWMNVIAGLTILLCQAYPRFITIDSDSGRRNMHYDVGMKWVIAYTLWDFTFIYSAHAPSEISGLWIGLAVIHLLTPLLMTLKDASLYLQLRVYSLTVVVGYTITLPYEPWIVKTPHWYSADIDQGLALLSLSMALYLAYSHLLPWLKSPHPPPICYTQWQAL